MIQPYSQDSLRRGNGEASALHYSVLILNRFYMPVHVVTVRRAIVMLYRDLGEVIHVEDGQFYNYDFYSWLELSELLDLGNDPSVLRHRDFIRSVHYRIEAPRVVRLYRYDKVPRQVMRFNRRNLLARDNYQCQFCEQQFPPTQLSLDHVMPRSRGGGTNWENVVCSCLRCNSRKGNRTPDEAGMRLVRPPVRPQQNPALSIKLDSPRYESWRPFLKSGNANIQA